MVGIWQFNCRRNLPWRYVRSVLKCDNKGNAIYFLSNIAPEAAPRPFEQTRVNSGIPHVSAEGRKVLVCNLGVGNESDHKGVLTRTSMLVDIL